MAKKQTRRSISVSRTTYERLKAFCEANNISMSQLVETRVNDFLGDGPAPTTGTQRPPTSVGIAPGGGRPSAPSIPTVKHDSRPAEVRPQHQVAAHPPQQVPMTSAAARHAVEPPPPIIKQRPQEAAPKPTEKSPDQIFTF